MNQYTPPKPRKRFIDYTNEEIEALGRQVVREIRANNKAIGLPIIFYKDDTIYYELPDGTITKEPPPGFGNYKLQQSPPVAV